MIGTSEQNLDRLNSAGSVEGCSHSFSLTLIVVHRTQICYITFIGYLFRKILNKRQQIANEDDVTDLSSVYYDQR